MGRGKKYTRAQQKAYYSGMGYAVRGAGRNIKFSSNDIKESFLAGCMVGSRKAMNNGKKYPQRKGR